MEEKKVDVAILGSGSAGLYAVSKVKPSGKSFVLINGGEVGTTCARVGCMPSKALIQVAEDFHRRGIMGRYGIEGYKDLTIDTDEAIDYVRDMRDGFVDRVTSNSTDNMPPHIFIEDYARFTGPNTLETSEYKIQADKIIIATGSSPIMPEAWKAFGDKIFTTDDVFELEQLPESLAVIGMGVIGLELGQALARLEVKVIGFDAQELIGGLSDPDIAKVARDVISRDFPIHTGSTVSIVEHGEQLKVTAGDVSVVVDKVLACMGRSPNLANLDFEKAGIVLNDKGMPNFNVNTMQIEDSHIFIAGDVNGTKSLLHEAGDEGKIAGYNATSQKVTSFQRRVNLGIVFCDPNIATVGQGWHDLKDKDDIVSGEVNFAPVGRAMIMGKNRGILKVYGEKSTGRLLGCEMVCATGEHLAHLIALAIHQKMTVGQLLQMPFYHPVIEEALQAALNDLYSKVDKKMPSPIMELPTIE